MWGSALRTGRQRLQTAVRRFSAHGSEAEKEAETVQWKKYSAVMVGVTGFFTVYNVVLHSHDHRRDDLPYLRIRTKPFPWRECPTCDLFDGACWDKCRGKEVADDHH